MEAAEIYCALLVGMPIGATTMENSMEGLQKIKSGTALWLSDSTFGYIFDKMQNTNLKEHMYLYVHCSIIYNSQDMEATQVSINRWVDKKSVAHIHNGIWLGHKIE